jgi:hypothetical protein
MNQSLLSLLARKAADQLPDLRDDVAPGAYGPAYVRVSVSTYDGQQATWAVALSGLTVAEDGCRAPSLPAADTLAALLDLGLVSTADLEAAMALSKSASKASAGAVKDCWARAAVAAGVSASTVRGGVKLIDPVCAEVVTELREVAAK